MVDNSPEAPQSLIDLSYEKEIIQKFGADLAQDWSERFGVEDIIHHDMFRGALLTICSLRELRAEVAAKQAGDGLQEASGQ